MFNNNNISKLSDEDLLLSHKDSGKNIYIGELFNRYLPLIYGVCLKYLKDADNAHEAIMQLFDNLLFNISYYEIDTFRLWIYNVTKNHCLQILQNEEQSIMVDFDDNDMEPANFVSLIDEAFEEHPYLLMDCLNKLPEKQRVSISYFYIDELSYAEIVEKTGYTLKNVKSYIQNGSRNLIICLEKNDI